MKSLFALCLLLAFQPATAAETQDYVILRQGKPPGYKTIVHGDDGVYRSTHYYKDNGRGPELAAPTGRFTAQETRTTHGSEPILVLPLTGFRSRSRDSG